MDKGDNLYSLIVNRSVQGWQKTLSIAYADSKSSVQSCVIRMLSCQLGGQAADSERQAQKQLRYTDMQPRTIITSCERQSSSVYCVLMDNERCGSLLMQTNIYLNHSQNMLSTEYPRKNILQPI